MPRIHPQLSQVPQGHHQHQHQHLTLQQQHQMTQEYLERVSQVHVAHHAPQAHHANQVPQAPHQQHPYHHSDVDLQVTLDPDQLIHEADLYGTEELQRNGKGGGRGHHAAQQYHGNYHQ